jgi:hypothetical protein
MGNSKFGWRSGVASMKGLKVGDDKTVSTEIKQVKVYSATIDPAEVAANTVVLEDFTVTGLTTDDKVVVNAGIDTIGIGNVRVSAANTLRVTFINPTGLAINPASSTWKIIAIRS